MSTPNDLAAPDGTAWDLLVIGGGTAGIVAAKTAAGFGASVLLVERDRTGGDCLWTGCVPSKALLAAAQRVADLMRADRFGIKVPVAEIDFGAVMAHVRGAITTIAPVDSPEALQHAGVHVASATASFTGSDTALVGEVTVRFRQALIATGAAPILPRIPGLAEANPLTSETVWQLTELPRRLLVLGGGSVGCELAQAFARLGSVVTVVEAGERVLPREPADAATVVAAALAADGVDLRTGVSVDEIRDAGAHRAAVLSDATTIEFDTVLVAVGRAPRTGALGLARAAVELDARGHVWVDGHLRTSNHRIWAAGDVTSHPQFTHTAGVHAGVAASNAVLGLRRRANPATNPRVTFTDPELASFGVTDAARDGLTQRTVDHVDVDRAIAEGRTAGFTRLALDRRGRIVGATIVGPRAGESLAEVVLAARHGLRARDVAASTHAYPTYSDGVWKAAIEQVQAQLRRPSTARVTRVLSRVRRRRVSS